MEARSVREPNAAACSASQPTKYSDTSSPRAIDRRTISRVQEFGSGHGQLKAIVGRSPQANETSLWLRRLEAIPGTADPSVGRRLFHGSIGRCSQCHRHAGRGNVVGPELTYISRQGDRENLLRSILEPNRDVAPQYFSTALQLADGNIFTGILLRSSSTEVFRDDKGKERVFQKKEIVDRKELKTSMMPSGLIEQMTDEEIRDLLAFLMSPNP